MRKEKSAMLIVPFYPRLLLTIIILFLFESGNSQSYQIQYGDTFTDKRKGFSYYRIAPDDLYDMPEIDIDELDGGSEQLLHCLKCKHLPDDDISLVPRDMDAYQRNVTRLWAPRNGCMDLSALAPARFAIHP